MSHHEMPLRYGCNPHQKPARVFVREGALPIKALSGAPGYINLLDALNSWQLVKELRQILALPAAASFKHVSPAGAAVGIPLDETMRKACFVGDLELSPLASAYARARGGDRMSSFGDWAALSDVVDVSTARLLNREVSDGVIAPAFDPAALEILKAKRKGKYNVIEIDPEYRAPDAELREVFGITFEQRRNDWLAGEDLFDDIVTQNKDLPDSARRDLLVATIALKYTQSNSVCFAVDGQVIGLGAGQQSRIHCTRLAATKADTWYLRQHPAVLGLEFRKGLNRAEQNNAIDQYLLDDLTPAEQKVWEANFEKVPSRLSKADKRQWLNGLEGVSLSSDAFFPFRDSIDRASQTGVKYVLQPGHSLRDDIVIQACNEYGMVMAFSGVRLFHH
jgi:phosphoribosylaminoimidazolecarboxamide formyltransferase/IMP cyclohydrolase